MQLYRILFGDSSVVDESPERLRPRRDTRPSPEYSDELWKHLADIPGLSDTDTALIDQLTGTSMSLLDHLFTASHIQTDGIIYQLIRDNPKLLLNPEVRRLVVRMLEAVGRNEMDSFLDTYDVNEVIALLKVSYHKHVFMMQHVVWYTR